MKRLTFTIVLFLLIGFIYSCDENTTKDNDLTELGFRGNIESIVETQYELSSKFGEEQIGNIKRKTVLKFNNDGNKIEVSHYQFKCEFIYNEKDNKLKMSYDDSDEELFSKYKYTYDEKGNLLETNNYESDGNLLLKCKYTYDKKGNIIEENCYNSDMFLLFKHKYTYDEKGNLLEINNYDLDGKLSSKHKYTYDKKGNKIEERLYNVNNILETPIELTKYEITYR